MQLVKERSHHSIVSEKFTHRLKLGKYTLIDVCYALSLMSSYGYLARAIKLGAYTNFQREQIERIGRFLGLNEDEIWQK